MANPREDETELDVTAPRQEDTSGRLASARVIQAPETIFAGAASVVATSRKPHPNSIAADLHRLGCTNNHQGSVVGGAWVRAALLRQQDCSPDPTIADRFKDLFELLIGTQK